MGIKVVNFKYKDFMVSKNLTTHFWLVSYDANENYPIVNP